MTDGIDSNDSLWKITQFVDNPGTYGETRYEFDWEREWRVPHGLVFGENEVAFPLAPEDDHAWMRQTVWLYLAAVAYQGVVLDPLWDIQRVQRELKADGSLALHLAGREARMSRPRETWRCAFCGEPGRKSDEHVLPQWMRRVTGPLPMERTSHRSGFDLLDDGHAYASVGESVRMSRNSLLHQVTRTVCTNCNNGWMSQLEMAAEPILKALFAARRDSSTVTLSSNEAAVLASWAVKTSWTSELAGLGNQNQDRAWLPPAMRQDLASVMRPPASSWVWLASCHSADLCQQLQAHVTFDRTSPPTPGEAPCRLLSSCLILNGLALLVYSFDRPMIFPPPLRAPHGLLLWPKPSPVEFPPPAVFQRDLLLAIGRYTPWLALHDRPFDHLEGVAQRACVATRQRHAPEPA